MRNTVKVPTVAWAVVALVFFPYYFPASYNLLVFAVRLIAAALFGYFAYKSYKNGLPPEASLEERARSRSRSFGQLAAAVVVLLVGLLVGVGMGMIRPDRMISALPFAPGIEGRYTDPKGNRAEFIDDGTAVFVIGGQQVIWKWTQYDGNRLKLEPGPGVFGVSAGMCNYQVNATTLRVTGCEWAMVLTRI